MWQETILQNLCEITSSKRIYAADYQSEGVPFFRGKEIIEKHNGNTGVSTELFISEEKFLEIKRKFGVPQPGDLLLTSVGTLGVPYVVKPSEEFYFKDGNLTWFKYFKNLDSRYASLCLPGTPPASSIASAWPPTALTAFRARASLINIKRSSFQLLAVEAGDRGLGFSSGRHLHEAESSGLATVPVLDNVHRCYLPESLKCLA